MTRLHVGTGSLKVGASKLRGAADEARRELVTVVRVESLALAADAQEHAPIFTGLLVKGIRPQPVQIIGRSIQGQVTATAPHTVVLEDGRTAGARRPPSSVIERWIDLKIKRGQFNAQLPSGVGKRGGSRRSAYIKGMAFVIARAIGRRGWKGVHFMRDASARAQVRLKQRVNEVVQRWSRR